MHAARNAGAVVLDTPGVDPLRRAGVRVPRRSALAAHGTVHAFQGSR